MPGYHRQTTNRLLHKLVNPDLFTLLLSQSWASLEQGQSVDPNDGTKRMWDKEDTKIIFTSDQPVIECRFPEVKG